MTCRRAEITGRLEVIPLACSGFTGALLIVPPILGLAHPAGFEPATFAFGGRHSIQLSYGCIKLERCIARVERDVMAVRASICAVVLALLCGLASECSAKRNIAFYAFKGGADGAYAYGGLVQDASGDFYGTTGNGGSGGNCAGGCGTLFKLTAGGTHAVIHNFTGGMDGNWPNADLVSDAAGNIYGSTVIGNSSTGSIFKLATDGAFSVLHTFDQTHGS